ncbi:hypothetical protein NQ318_010090 [Aromia moschata]|uniref:Luciferin 4-monooxygenase n=1 Tax=Aromia moschata TaxID=1265417 RepID=A0AAV8Y8R2_9CUCU|nr:hypothetical protein NQ318_010090 [Aromia moschata]
MAFNNTGSCRNPGFNHRNDDELNMEDGLGVVLFKKLKKHKNKILQYIADTGEVDTYEQVLIRSIRTALKLEEMGLGKDDVISMCTYNHKNSCIPLVATFFIGAISANFDPKLSPLDTIHLLKLMQPKVMFVSIESLSFMEKCMEEAKVKCELVVFGDSERYIQFSEFLEPHPKEENFEPTALNDSKETAAVLFSSGTTGLPKGICLSHASLLGWYKNSGIFAVNSGDGVNLVYTTFYWISALWFFIESVIRGDARVVCSKFDPYELWHIIEKYKITSIFLAPHLANEFIDCRLKDVDTSSLKLLLMGGSAPTENMMSALREGLPGTKVFNGYGQTEALTCITVFDESNPEEVEMQIRKPMSCGKVRKAFQWKVVDPVTEEVLGPNQRGELRIKCDLMMSGYYKMDSSSAYDSEGYLKTGDIFYYDDEGCFFVVDRIKEMFKYKAYHILPAILEDVLMTHPAVKEAAVIGIPHGIEGEYPMGVVVLREGYGQMSPNEIEEYVEKRVPEMQRLRAGVKIVKELCRTATSKLRRAEIKKMVLEGKI